MTICSIVIRVCRAKSFQIIKTPENETFHDIFSRCFGSRFGRPTMCRLQSWSTMQIRMQWRSFHLRVRLWSRWLHVSSFSLDKFMAYFSSCQTRCQSTHLDCTNTCPCGPACPLGCSSSDGCALNSFCSYRSVLLINHEWVAAAFVINTEDDSVKGAAFDYNVLGNRRSIGANQNSFRHWGLLLCCLQRRSLDHRWLSTTKANFEAQWIWNLRHHSHGKRSFWYWFSLTSKSNE